MDSYNLDNLRDDIIGRDLLFPTPFGLRNIFYADYTASGRGLKSIEKKILNIMESYANTHTVDDYSGKYLTRLLHAAEHRIKDLVNAGKNGKLIAIGSGSTGALKKLQEIIGVYIPPVTRERVFQAWQDICGYSSRQQRELVRHKPVVFIGPYEHHTNELMWREAFVDVVVIQLDGKGMIDLKDLEKKLSLPEYENRFKIASISAGSNITGIRTRIYDVARICHNHGTRIFFDFAAVAPYVEIDMNRSPDSRFDAIFFSPHKFLGGPGTSGLLIFDESLYRRDLPPTTAGGGTVVYVGFSDQDYSSDIETREKAGTPPILQTIKAALVMDLKEKIGTRNIEKIETDYITYFMKQLVKTNNIDIIGSPDPQTCVSIASFNIRHRDRILHPKFVTRLLNDLFGIQSRAGCSCAGPYGHVLLGIDTPTSDKIRHCVLNGCEGLKPGWVRINLHYTFTRDDLDYLLRAIEYVAEFGHLFLKTYAFDLHTAEWKHLDFQDEDIRFTFDNDFSQEKIEPAEREALRRGWLEKARSLADQMKHRDTPPAIEDLPEIEALKFFYYYHSHQDS